MNSLNESASMDMDSPVQDGPASTDDCNSKEAIGTISKAYRDIFIGGNSSSHERSTSRANVTANNNNNIHPFSQDGNFQVSSHPAPTQSNKSCPVAPAVVCPVASNNNQPAFHKVDNHYSYLMSRNQNHNQSNAAISQRVSNNPNKFYTEEGPENHTSCPWKLAPGAKVLVRTRLYQSWNNIPSCWFIWQVFL